MSLPSVFPEMRTQVYSYTVRQLAEWAQEGLRLPRYQRGLVWTPEQALRLVQSVWDGYPIGTFLVWECKYGEPLLLLDGQQRLASLSGLQAGTGEAGPMVGWSLLGGKWSLGPISSEDDWLTLHWWHVSDIHTRLERLGELKEKYETEEESSRQGPWGLALRAFGRIESASASISVLSRATAAEAAEAFRRLNVEGTPFDADELARLLERESEE